MKTIWILLLCFFLSACQIPTEKTETILSIPDTITISGDADLLAQTEFFAARMEEAGIRIEQTEEQGFIQLGIDTKLEEEAYRIEANTSIYIYGGSEAGIFYGLNYVWKALAGGYDFYQGMVYASFPQTSERSLLLDTGRKYYTVEEIHEILDLMAQNNLNTFVWHFSEEMGLRLESKLYPWLAGSDTTLGWFPDTADPDEGKYYTQQEAAEIVQYASALHIQVIPSFDSPGHMRYILSRVKEVLGEDYAVSYNWNGSSGETVSSTLDLANPLALEFVQSLVEEYAAFFYSLGCRQFDLGGDEMFGSGRSYIGSDSKVKWQALDSWKELAQELSSQKSAQAYDLFIWYMNTMNRQLKSMGYEACRMWNDELYRSHDTGWNQAIVPDTDIDVEWWNSDGGLFLNQPELYASQGHQLINCTNFYNYYILNPSLRYLGVYPAAIYREYTSTRFLTHTVDEDAVKGSCFCIWADAPSAKTGQEVIAEVGELLFYNGIKVWDPAVSSEISYDKMRQIYLKTG